MDMCGRNCSPYFVALWLAVFLVYSLLMINVVL